MTILARLLLAIALLLGGAGAAAADPAFPVTVEHALGSTVVETEPQRVVALIDRDADTLLALGVVPVAIRSNYGFADGVGAWARQALGDARPVVWTGRELNFEAIAAVRPDLIVFANSDGDAATYALLSAIAPTVPLPQGATAWGATTAQTTRLIAAAVGRPERGEELLDGLAAYLAAQRQAHPEFAGRTATYLDIYPGGIASYNKAHFVNDVLFSVGFEPNAATRELPAEQSSVTVSTELLANYDADIVVYYPFGRTEAEILAETPLLASLSSFASGRALRLEDLAFSTASVLSIPYALDALLPRAAAALDD